jgi:cephalosporin hydroxylase
MEPWNRRIIDEKYHYLRSVRSDINEFFPTIVKYTRECDSVLELGVRWVVGTWAFLYGLREEDKDYDYPKKYVGIDIDPIESWDESAPELLQKGADQRNIDYQFLQTDDLDPKVIESLPDFDLVFIDTLHTYDQVKKELEAYHSKANKYIMLHDTISFRYGGFDGDEIGIWPAVTEFLSSNQEWELWESLPKWPGLTILKRK